MERRGFEEGFNVRKKGEIRKRRGRFRAYEVMHVVVEIKKNCQSPHFHKVPKGGQERRGGKGDERVKVEKKRTTARHRDVLASRARLKKKKKPN